MTELIEIKVWDNDRRVRYSFLLDCELESKPFKEVVDECLANGEDGWACTAQRLSEIDHPLSSSLVFLAVR